MASSSRPRRSALYTPGSNLRAIEKAKSLAVDCLILDLEDAVAPESKAIARQNIATALQAKEEFGHREVVVRVNGLDTTWGEADVRTMLDSNVDAILFPKIDRCQTLDRAVALVADGGWTKPIWCMIETPRGVLHVEEIADHPQVTGLVLGTSDLTTDLRAVHTSDRLPMLSSLSLCLLAARAAGIAILDGVHLHLADDDGLRLACQQGRELGFDGKTLIHPKQAAIANSYFAPTDEELAWSRKVIEAHSAAVAAGSGVVLVDGKLIENLHVREAERVLQVARMVDQLGAAQGCASVA